MSSGIGELFLTTVPPPPFLPLYWTTEDSQPTALLQSYFIQPYKACKNDPTTTHPRDFEDSYNTLKLP